MKVSSHGVHTTEHSAAAPNMIALSKVTLSILDDATQAPEAVYDVAIVGGGPAGLALAAGLAQSWRQAGFDPGRIAVLDAKPLAQAQLDPRTLALTDSSRRFLEPFAFPATAMPIDRVHVTEQSAPATVLMQADEVARQALGWTMSYGSLVAALDDAAQRAGATVRRGVQVLTSPQGQSQATAKDAELVAAEDLKVALRIDADGGTFGNTAPRDQYVDYGDWGLVAKLAWPTQALSVQLQEQLKTWRGTAIERFTPSGPLALLPAAVDGGSRVSADADQVCLALIWCAPQALTAERAGWSDQELRLAVADVLGDAIPVAEALRHESATVSPRHQFALGLNVRDSLLIGPRHAVVGNAAQIIHPVAAQGLNLGLRDVAAMVSRLDPSLFRPSLFGPSSFQAMQQTAIQQVLDAYDQDRRRDRERMVRLTDYLVRGFTHPSPLVKGIRQAVMMGLQHLPMARRAFIRAMVR